ncbi:MAG TPA: hypothetical protein VKF79_03565 [Candidatus Acidoferrum sp.]|nr:hypothetical protein [Candidatus Acidoferrum sp.]
MKTDVYSWRLSRGLKSEIERAARLKKMRVSAVLDSAVRDWLAKNAEDVAEDEEQRRLHAAVAPFIGSIRGKNPHRAETAAALIKKSLRRRYAR